MPADPVTTAARQAAIRTAAMRAAEEYVRSRIWRLEELAVAALGELYLAAYRDLAGRLAQVFAQYGAGDTWSAADLAFRTRTEILMQAMAADVARLTDAVVAATFEAAVRGYGAGYFGRAWLLDQGLRAVSGIHLALLPVEAIRAAILAPYVGSTFLDRFLGARDEFVARIRRSIVASQIRGETLGQAVKRLAEELGITGRGGYRARLEMIARTEILRSSNLGAMAVYDANRDILNGWQWLASRDERVCPVCGALDGQQFKLDARQSPPPAHTRCRCTPVAVLINSALEAAIVGPRQTYREWAAARGVSIVNDGGVLRFERGARAPKAPIGESHYAAA